MSFWMPWRKKRKWNCEEVDFHVLWKAIVKMYKKNRGVNGLNAANVGCILDRYWIFDKDIYVKSEEVLQIFKEMDLVYEDKGTQTSIGGVANGMWVNTYWPVERIKI